MKLGIFAFWGFTVAALAAGASISLAPARAQAPVPETWFTEKRVGGFQQVVPAGTVLAQTPQSEFPEARVLGVTAKCASPQAGMYWFQRVDSAGAIQREQGFDHVAQGSDSHPTVVNVTVQPGDRLQVVTALQMTGTFSCSIHITIPVQQ